MKCVIPAMAVIFLALPANAQVEPTVKGWLGSCQRDFVTCDMDVSANEADSGVARECIPAADMVETRAVVNWLTAHPETYNEDSQRGIQTALVALYKCSPIQAGK